MVAPTLANYTYQYKDAGVGTLLNGDTSPFWDVEKVQGLVDFPTIDSTVLDLDGRHGSFVSGKFFKSRTIVIDGTLYDTVANVDATLQTFRTSMLPDDVDYPLYWKHPTIAQRYYMAKPLGLSADVETGRRTGAMPFQAQWGCTDPRAFQDLSTVNWTSGVNTSAFSNTGNVNGLLNVNIASASSNTTASITLGNTVQFSTVTITFPVTSGQSVSIDTDFWIVRVNGAVVPANMTPGSTGYPTFYPGSNIWVITSNIGNGTITAKSAWL